MSSTEDQKQEKGKQENQNAVIEIKISIPPLFGGNLGGMIDHMGKAARELARAGKSMVFTDNSKPAKVRKIEIK